MPCGCSQLCLNPAPRLEEDFLSPPFYDTSKGSRSLALALGVSTNKLFVSPLLIYFIS